MYMYIHAIYREDIDFILLGGQTGGGMEECIGYYRAGIIGN